MACANANVEHSNGSQFFITLGPTESLQKKNTIFGKVSGETIYNVMEINNLEVDDNDRCASRVLAKHAGTTHAEHCMQPHITRKL